MKERSMSEQTTSPDVVREQANELYWNSGETVEKIGRQLGLSRKAMYSSVRPVPAGGACPHCEEELVFTNRTARAAGDAYCPGCEMQVPLDAPHIGTGPERLGKEVLNAVEPVPQPRGVLEQWREDLSRVPPQRVAIIGGLAALGVAAGAATVRVLRNR
jgi:hypothetical protein